MNLHGPCGHKALNLARLPIPPPARGRSIVAAGPRRGRRRQPGPSCGQTCTSIRLFAASSLDSSARSSSRARAGTRSSFPHGRRSWKPTKRRRASRAGAAECTAGGAAARDPPSPRSSRGTTERAAGPCRRRAIRETSSTHPEEEPMHARVARYDVPPETLQAAIAGLRQAGDDLGELEGMLGGYVLADPESGTTLTLTLWDSARSMSASGTRAASLRRRALRDAGGSVVSVEEYQVAVDFGRARLSARVAARAPSRRHRGTQACRTAAADGVAGRPRAENRPAARRARPIARCRRTRASRHYTASPSTKASSGRMPSSTTPAVPSLVSTRAR